LIFERYSRNTLVKNFVYIELSGYSISHTFEGRENHKKIKVTRS